MKVDFHLHTTASDGALSPAQLVALAASQGLEVIAITDHDSVEGIEEALEAARPYPGLTIIPGVEVSTDIPGDEVHILGYFVDHRSPNLQAALAQQRAYRLERAQKMVDKLAGLGLPISLERVLELAGRGSVGRPHIAQALLEKGYISSLSQAFNQYIGRNGPAYVEKEKITPAQVVSLVSQGGGLPALAHPADMLNLETQLVDLKAAGLAGLEAYYSGYSSQTSRRLEALAHRFGLLTSGGSDYHGLNQSQEGLPGSVAVPERAVRQLLAWKEKARRC